MGGRGAKFSNSKMLLNPKQFDDYVKKNKTIVLYRGFSDDTVEGLEKQRTDMQNKTARLSGEKTSAAGKGLYFAGDIETANGYSVLYNKKYSDVITATVRKNAKILSNSELGNLYSEKNNKQLMLSQKYWNTNSEKLRDKLKKQIDFLQQIDIASYAKSKGFDVIDNGFNEYVVVNQNVLIYKNEK